MSQGHDEGQAGETAQSDETAQAESQLTAQPVVQPIARIEVQPVVQPIARIEAQPSEAENKPFRLLPGLEVVGRGIYLRPYQPYQLGQLLFKHDEIRVTTSKETHESYLIPVGYEVNDSPPFPMNESLNQTVIEESWDRFEQQMNMNMRAKGRLGSISVSATSSWNSRLRADQEAYYAVRSSFVPLWTVYIPNLNKTVEALQDAEVPIPYAPEHRQKYEAFFRSFGSHCVRSAWVGGKSMLVFTVFKSSQISKDEIRAGLRASMMIFKIGEGDTQDERSKERLRNSSQCTVIGKGGDEVKLAEMSSLDHSSYNKWLETIPDNPQVIEMEVEGIWTLMRDQARADTLEKAYHESISFDPIRAVFEIGRAFYIVRTGGKYVRYDRDTKRTSTGDLGELLPVLKEDGFDRIDEAIRGYRLTSPTGERLDRKLFLFRMDRVTRIDIDTMTRDPGYPMTLAEAFPGIPFERVDAALITGPDTLYLFYGNRYARFNPMTGKFDEGYPQPIAKRWSGITFERIDAAVYWGNSKVYFFKNDQHIRYDLTNYCSDPGYPQHVSSNYVEDWTFLDA
jgi:hypothetical protein